MNQVFNQIQEKKKAEKETINSAASDNATSSPEPAAPTTKAKTNSHKPKEKKAAASKPKEKTFEDGVRFAISQIKNGISLEEIEKSLTA